MEPAAVFAHHKRLLLGYSAFEIATKRSNKVDKDLKLLAEMKAAMMVGCEWCIDFGAMLMDESSVPERKLRDLPIYEESDCFSGLEKLVLRYAEAMTKTPAEISDELFEELREHFDEAQLVELTSAIAIENYRARFNWALGMAPQGFSDGAYCPMPEEKAQGPKPS